MRTMVDDWVKKNIEMYQENKRQVLYKHTECRHRREVLSEMSLLVQANPNLTQLAPDIEAYLSLQLAPIPPEVKTYVAHAGLREDPQALLSPPPDFTDMWQAYGRKKMTARHLFQWKKPGQSGGICEHKWTQGGESLVCERVSSDFGKMWKVVPHTPSKTSSQIVLRESQSTKFDVAADGVSVDVQSHAKDKFGRVLTWKIIVCLPGQSATERAMPAGAKVTTLAIDKDNVYAILYNENTLNCYDRNFLKARQYNLGSHTYPQYAYIHSNNQGKVMVSSITTHSVYVVDLKSGVTISFGGYGQRDGELNGPIGMCTVNNGHHVLVCDSFNTRISMFTLDGFFICHLSLEGDRGYPMYVSALCRPPPHTASLAVTTATWVDWTTYDLGGIKSSALNFYSVDTFDVKTP